MFACVCAFVFVDSLCVAVRIGQLCLNLLVLILCSFESPRWLFNLIRLDLVRHAKTPGLQLLGAARRGQEMSRIFFLNFVASLCLSRLLFFSIFVCALIRMLRIYFLLIPSSFSMARLASFFSVLLNP